MSIESGPEEAYVVIYNEEDEAQARLRTGGATSDPVKDYLKQIGKTPLLDAETEVELAKEIETGLYVEQLLARGVLSHAKTRARPSLDEAQYLIERGVAARNRMMEANLRLVVSRAKKYARPDGLEMLDLIQEGNLGLERAVNKFDYTKGYKFSTYAVWWIRQSIVRGIDETERTIRLTTAVAESIRILYRVQRTLEARFERRPTDPEIAEEMDISPERVAELKEFNRRPISLDTPIGEASDTEFGDLIEDNVTLDPDDVAVKFARGDAIRSVLRSELNPREADILMRWKGMVDGREWTLKEIGDYYGITRERIRQLKEKALKKILESPDLASLRDFYE